MNSSTTYDTVDLTGAELPQTESTLAVTTDAREEGA